MKALDGCYSMLGISPSSRISEVRLAFKKKSYSLHPDRHPGNPGAFSNFVNVNEAFVEIIKDFESRAMQSGSEDPDVSLTLQKCEEYIPGEVDIKGNGISCKVQHYKIWRRVLKDRYPDAIVGKQRKNSISSLKQNIESGVKGIRFILRFKLKGVDDNYFKVNLAIYDTDLLVVTGTSYFLWVMDNFKEISNEVLRIWEEENKVVEEKEQEDESHQETLSTDTRCCELEYNKLSDRVTDIDKKMLEVSERLNLMIDKQEQIMELHTKYSSIESKLDQILHRLDSPPVSCQSDGAQTYLVGPDRFEELKEWFKEFCLKELKEDSED